VGAFEAIVLGTRGAPELRAAHCRNLRDGGFLGALIAVCVDVDEGESVLDAGADDFVTMPYEVVELATRVRACVRRVTASARMRWGPMELDRVSRVLHLRGWRVALTNRECGLLACLIQAGGDVVSRATLRERVWHRTEDRGTNVVEVHLSRLREKLGEDAAAIETVRRAGYRLRRLH
jgi:DNA-binding response OmpR family regulator